MKSFFERGQNLSVTLCGCVFDCDPYEDMLYYHQ